MLKLKKLVKELLPPFITRQLKKHRSQKIGWIGKYNDWNEVKSITKGYDSDLIIKHVSNSMMKVKNGEFAFERDGGLFDKIQYSFPLLSGLLYIASKNGNKLNLIDFGGSLGSSYYQNKELLSHLNKISWNIVEQPQFVLKGKAIFENEALRFYDDLQAAFKASEADTLLLLGVLEYIEKPYDLLKTISDLNFKYIIFDRTPFSNCTYDFVCKQVVPPITYEASYPCWIFNENNILNALSDKYELVYDFSSNFGLYTILNHTIEHKGLFLKHK